MHIKIPPMLYIVLRIAFILMVTEFLIMLVLYAIPHHMSVYQASIVDALALVLLSIPLISIFVIKPFLVTRAKALARIRNMSLTDPLTSLANRQLVINHLDRVVAGCTRHSEYCAVMLINLDNFKLVNTKYGFDAGNTILVELARRIHATIRANDIVGRIGGDEFVVLLERLESDENVTGESVMQIANKLLGVIDMPIAINSKTAQVKASIGIRLLGSEPPVNSVTALNEAENAMYRAKEVGGGRAVIF